MATVCVRQLKYALLVRQRCAASRIVRTRLRLSVLRLAVCLVLVMVHAFLAWVAPSVLAFQATVAQLVRFVVLVLSHWEAAFARLLRLLSQLLLVVLAGIILPSGGGGFC